MPLPESRLPHVGTTIFAVMSKMAAEHGAINLSQGFPDFEVDEGLKELVAKAIRDGKNQYAPMPGLPELRIRLAEKYRHSHNVDINWDNEITITSGATEALFCAIGALVRPGDEVILFAPAYDSYEPAINIFGGKARYATLQAPHFAPDWAEVESLITSRTRAILINTPHNPCGSLFSESDIVRLEAIALKYDLMIISDEVYEHIIFDGAVHHSPLSRPALKDRVAAVFSFGKTFHATGWKLGYVLADSAISAEIRKIHQFVVFCSPMPFQHAIAEYIGDSQRHESLGIFYQSKRDFFLKQLEGSKWTNKAALGSYFQLLDYSLISDLDDRSFAELLTKEHRVASIPLSPFYPNGTKDKLLRFCFAKKEETLFEACQILKSI